MMDLDVPNPVKDAARARNFIIIISNRAKIEADKFSDKVLRAKNREILETLSEMTTTTTTLKTLKEQLDAINHIEDVYTQCFEQGEKFEVNPDIAFLIMNSANEIHHKYYKKHYSLKFCIDCHHDITLNIVLNYLDCDIKVKEKCKEEILAFRETLYILAGYAEFLLYYTDKDSAMSKIILLFSEPFSDLVDKSEFKLNKDLVVYATFKEIYKIYFFLLIYSLIIYPIEIDYYKRPIINFPIPSFVYYISSSIVETVKSFKYNPTMINEIIKLRRVAFEGIIERLIIELPIYSTEYKLKAISYVKKLNEIKYREINKSVSIKDYMENVAKEIEKYNLKYNELEAKIIHLQYTNAQECSIKSCRNIAFEIWKLLTKTEILLRIPSKVPDPVPVKFHFSEIKLY